MKRNLKVTVIPVQPTPSELKEIGRQMYNLIKKTHEIKEDKQCTK